MLPKFIRQLLKNRQVGERGFRLIWDNMEKLNPSILRSNFSIIHPSSNFDFNSNFSYNLIWIS